jgi:hypothetical protein
MMDRALTLFLCVCLGIEAPQDPPTSRPVPDGIPGLKPAVPGGTKIERPAPGTEPAVKFARTEHPFGDVDAGSSSTTTFEFVNEGTGPLKIFTLRPSCGCALTSVEAGGKPYELGAPIEPGVKGQITVALNATWRAGEKRTYIDVLTNDPALQPTSEAPFGHVKLHVSARIVRPVELYTEAGAISNDGRLEFGVFHFSSPTKKTIEVRSTKGQAFDIARLTPTDPRFRVAFAPVGEDKKAWRIEVEPVKDLPLGAFLFPLTIETRPESPGLVLFLTGLVRGALTIEPGLLQGLRLPMPRDPAKPSTAKLTLRSSAGPIALTELRLAEPSDFKPQEGRFVPTPGKTPRDAAAAIADNLTFETKLLDQGMTAVLEIRVKPTMPEGFFNAMLVFKTGVEGGPAELAVPVSGFGTPKAVK